MFGFVFKDTKLMLFGMFKQSGKHYVNKSIFPVV